MTFNEAIQTLVAAPEGGKYLRVHFCTAHTLVEASDSSELRSALNTADVVATDGVPLVWLGRLQGHRLERVCGPDVMLAVASRGREHGYRHYFYGGAEGVPERLATRLRAMNPGLEVVGAYSPPFRPLTAEEDAAVIERINAAAADYLWVGLGSPKQELWLAEHAGKLNVPVTLAVGAAFDFHSGRVRRAPAWMQRMGLEWLYRLVKEPRRLGRRYTVTNTKFVLLLVRDAVSDMRSRCRGKR